MSIINVTIIWNKINYYTITKKYDSCIIKDMEDGLQVQNEEKSVLKVKKMYKVIYRRHLNQTG